MKKPTINLRGGPHGIDQIIVRAPNGRRREGVLLLEFVLPEIDALSTSLRAVGALQEYGEQLEDEKVGTPEGKEHKRCKPTSAKAQETGART